MTYLKNDKISYIAILKIIKYLRQSQRKHARPLQNAERK